MSEQFANKAATTLSSAYTAGGSTLTVASTTSFPGSGSFRVLVDSEYMLAHVTSSTVLTIDSYGIESTSNANHSSGVAVTHILTAGGLVQAVADRLPVPGGTKYSIQYNGGGFQGSNNVQYINNDGGGFYFFDSSNSSEITNARIYMRNVVGDVFLLNLANFAVMLANGSGLTLLGIKIDGALTNDNQNVVARANQLTQVTPAAGSVSVDVTNATPEQSTISWAFSGVAAVGGGSYTISGSGPMGSGDDASFANGFPSGWTYSGNPGAGTVTGTGPVGGGQTPPSLDASQLTDSSSDDWEGQGGTVTPTFVDGTNFTAVITVVADSGSWQLNSSTIVWNDSGTAVQAAAGATSVGVAYTAPNTTVYNVNAITDISTAVNTNSATGLYDTTADGTLTTSLNQGNLQGNNGGTVSAFTPAALGDWTMSYDPTNNQMVITGFNGSAVQTATIPMT